MKISPSDVGHFKSAAQAKAYDRAQAVLENFRLVTEDLVSIDNKAVDANIEPGTVIVGQKNLLPFTNRESRQFISPPGNCGTKIPTDPVYLAQKNAKVEMKFDPASGKVDNLFLYGDGHRFEQRHSNGFLGLGQDRTVYEQLRPLPNHHFAGESVVLFADGTIKYDQYSF